jgi:hypothetical protein
MKILRILIIILISLPAFAQEEADEIRENPKAQEKIRAAQAAYITERLGLTPEEAEKFWPIYREFSQKRMGLREKFQEARRENKDEKQLLDLEFKMKQDQLDLEKDYSQKFQKVISPQKLMNLRQAEGDFRKLLLRQIHERQNQAERMQRQRDRNQERLKQRNN